MLAKPHAAHGGERRHLTVVFSDLVGSTQIAATLDPEEWHEIAREYQSEAAAAVERFGGHVAKYLGDGVMVCFGWPQAHENDPERAVRAGLAILDAVADLNRRLRAAKRPELSARVGIHTGPAVIGEDGNHALDVFGEAPNVAARVQAAAEPGTVMMTAAVRRLVSGVFFLEDCGLRTLKGIANQVEVFRAIRAAGVSERIPGAAHSLSPFVGREEEIALLQSCFARARDGQGQSIHIIGEAGIGKTRLMREFHERISAERHTWIETAADQFFGNTPLFTFRQALDHGLMWRGDESVDEKIAALEGSMKQAGLPLEHALPLVARMLHLPVPERYPPVLLAPEQERGRLLATLVTWALGSARVQPMVIALEDLHWADPSTLELARMMIAQGATAPLLLITTSRPEFSPPWPVRAHQTYLTLKRLSDDQVREMVMGMAARAALRREVVDGVVRRTTGVPLFVEELTRLVLEGGGKSAMREVPPTLSGSLMARLDRLGEAKQVAQIAAVIGREFDYRILSAIAGRPTDQLEGALRRLADSDLIYCRGVPPDSMYRFKHALVRDAAYEALFKSRRRELHRAIAFTLEHSFASRVESSPEFLAHHLAEAGDADQACKHWQRAGERAAARGALREAEDHFRTAIAALTSLPNNENRVAREIHLQLAAGQMMSATRGFSAAETAAAYARARSLNQKFRGGRRGSLLLGLWSVALTRGDLEGAQELADRCLEAAQNGARNLALSWAHYAQGQTRFFRGNLAAAEAHLMRSIELFESDGNPSPSRNPKIDSQAVAGATAWLLGFPDTALQRVSEAWQAARDLKLAFDSAFAGTWLCSVLMWRGEFERALVVAEEMSSISTEQQFPQYLALTSIYRGSVLASLGRGENCVALVRQGLAANAELDRRLALPELLTWLAEAQASTYDPQEAAATLDDALQAAPFELYWRPETLRLRGELALKIAQAGCTRHGDTTAQVEPYLREALELSRKIGARSLELRCATSLARLMSSRGHPQFAQELLGPLLDSFDQGHLTRDLVQARDLLDQLSP